VATLIDDVGVNRLMTQGTQNELEEQHRVQWYIHEDLQNLNYIYANVLRASAALARKTSGRWWNGVRKVRMLCKDVGRLPQVSKSEVMSYFAP